MLDEGAAEGVDEISLTMAPYAACASASVWMVGGTRPVASARIWWIAKTVHRFAVVGGFARWGSGIASACCWPSRWTLHAAENYLVCCQSSCAHSQRQ